MFPHLTSVTNMEQSKIITQFPDLGKKKKMKKTATNHFVQANRDSKWSS